MGVAITYFQLLPITGIGLIIRDYCYINKNFVHSEILFNKGPFVIQYFICPKIDVTFYRKLIKIWPTNTKIYPALDFPPFFFSDKILGQIITFDINGFLC